ncbi:MAG: ABC transporter permease [Chloroflexi bacterium]|nr:ABC transporter permease [Chloroflexota bacterium]
MQISLQRLSALIKKETVQLLRDRRTLIYIFGLPIIELFLFAYAVSLTVNHIPTALVDQSHDTHSQDFISAMQNSEYFDFTLNLQSGSQVIRAINSGQVKAGLIIPPDFSASIDRGDASVLILLDGSDSFSVQSGYSAASAIAQSFSAGLTAETVDRLGNAAVMNLSIGSLPITTLTRVLYNPDMKDMWFVLPAIAAMILQTLAVGQAAMAMVREREAGTMEQILVTPTRPIELILGKLIPLLVLVMLITMLILVVGIFWFGVPFKGDLALYLGLALLFILSSLGLGLLVSTISETQRQAQQISLVLMLFSMLLTGILYPRTAMPAVPQAIGSLIPLTYFIRISRAIITKGVGINIFWSDAVVLVAYGFIVMIIAAFSFKKRLD